MSTLPEQFASLGREIQGQLHEQARRVTDAKTGIADHHAQLGVMNISLNAVRAEVLERIGICEVMVLKKLDEMRDEMRRELKDIARQLGTNGTGGSHG